MDFEDQEEHDEEEEEMGGLPPESYDTLNSSRLKMGAPESGVNNTGPSPKPKYKECLKNHAVGMGGHAVDGCGEFMPAGPDGLKCAACDCHRNFHRKDSATSGQRPPPAGELFFHHQLPQFAPYYRTPAGYLQMAAAAQRPLALPSTSGGHSREDQEDGTDHGGGGSGRKRFRTKFTQEQKEKMLALAERLGWRIQKHDEGVVNEFCNETGVKRHVLKVWMHNNKHTLGKKP